MHDGYCCSALYLVWRLMHPLGRMTHVRVHKELGSEPTSENEERAYQIKSSFVLTLFKTRLRDGEPTL